MHIFTSLTLQKLSVGSIMMALWIAGLYGAIAGLWWHPIDNYYEKRVKKLGVVDGTEVLTALAVSGQWCAVTLGLVLAPVARHSALGSFFRISYTTTLRFHALVSYALLLMAIVHGLLYIYWIGYWKDMDKQETGFPALNPTFEFDEVYPKNKKSIGVWRATLIFTGTGFAGLLILINLTSIVVIRRKFFKLFYYTHTLSLFGAIAICFHSSMMFYCIAPGIFMWMLDYGMRLYELRSTLNAHITPLGKGWYLLTTALPRARLVGCAKSSPVARFYIYRSNTPASELLPFTTITHLALQDAITDPSEENIETKFLFRRHGGSTPFVSETKSRRSRLSSIAHLLDRYGDRDEVVPKENMMTEMGQLADKYGKSVEQNAWGLKQQDSFNLSERESERLDSLAVPPNVRNVRKVSKAEEVLDSASVPISIRLEGPFFTAVNPTHYRTVVCIVGGAGINGAIAIASAYQQLDNIEAQERMNRPQRSKSPTGLQKLFAEPDDCDTGLCSLPNLQNRIWRRCVIIWVVNEEDYIEPPGLYDSRDPGVKSDLEFRVIFTANIYKELNVLAVLDRVLKEDGVEQGKTKMGSLWCYIAGTKMLVKQAERACQVRNERGVEWLAAEIGV